MKIYKTSILILICATVATGARGQSERTPVLDARLWKITFPVQGPKGNALEIKNPEFTSFMEQPAGFPETLTKYFYRSEEGLVFAAEYTGVTTSAETKYSRTELREMNGAEENNWTIAGTSELRCRLKVTELGGGANKLFFMQIHGKRPKSKPLLKCIWEKGKIRLLTKTGEQLRDFKRKQDYAAVPLNEWFTCTIKINPQTLSIDVNGGTVETYTAEEVLNYWPKDNTYYFKVGNYLQHNTPGATSTVVFSSIEVSHRQE